MATIIDFQQSGELVKKPSLDLLMKLVTKDLDKVNSTILEHMQSPVHLIPQLAGHLIAAGGKRLRPMLTLGTASLCQYSGDRHIKLAACVEFIHTATLLHDDVVDASELRRGKLTANTVWGNQASVLVGDFLFSRAFQLMVTDGSLHVLKLLSNASAVIAEGEVHQMLTTNDTTTSEADYLEVIHSKTAELFSAAARIGAVVADRPKIEEEALAAYGTNLGVAFQLVDDALDYSARQAELGKTIGDDFSEGKITLPVILAFRRGNQEEKSFWKRCLEELEQCPEDLDKAQSLIRQHSSLEDTMTRARHYAALARDSLDLFNDCEAKQALKSVIDFCIEREF
ncbi:MAG: polyprenyl synthetase family protein [Pseudomonadota bacterium]|nr:polyprenyl synthetase family protein [Pseudomonadota bacterium]